MLLLQTIITSLNPKPVQKVNHVNPIYITERYDILDGEVNVLRTKQSKSIWPIRMHVRGEGACYGESLHTKHLQTAIARAKN